MLGLGDFEWKVLEVVDCKLHNDHPLFDRIDVARINEELEQLKQQSN